MRKLQRWLPVIFLAGAGLAALLILLAPSLPTWGKRHTAHTNQPSLALSSGHTIGQTFRFEENVLDLVVLWVDTTHPLPRDGGVQLTVRGDSGNIETLVDFADIPPSGTAVFRLTPVLRADAGSLGAIQVQLTHPRQQIGLRYQIDSSKYRDGDLVHEQAKKKGDLAFQIRYRRPALGGRALHGLYALGILVAGAVVSLVLRHKQGMEGENQVSRRDAGRALALGAAATLFYATFLVRPGFWVGPSDFSKDAAYLASASAALRTGAWPTWSHLTCGGMALLGNPEGNTLSLGTLFAAVLPADQALLLLLAVEGGLSATGTYLLARALGLRTAGSIAAALVASLSAGYAYRIVEGLTPVGGAVAFLPWVFFGLTRALQTRAGAWVVVSGTALAAMFLRGDVHVVVGVAMTVALWLILASARHRSVRPLGILFGIVAVAFLWSSIKILPYLEQSSLIQRDLPPYVVPLTKFGLLDDALLRIHDRDGVDVRPLHDRRAEQWGNFGGYVGALALVLAGVGMFTRHPARVPLVGAAALAFVVSEGALFEEVLRHQPILGSLLRMPTRVFSVFALFLGILAGIGLDRIMRDTKAPLRHWILSSFLLFLAADLGYATGRVLGANTDWSRTPATLFPSGPMLAPHANVSPEHERHATKLLRTGFLLPKICGDQNNPPAFIRQLKEPAPLATVPSEIRPNRILLSAPEGPADVIVRERFTTSWASDDATIMENDDGALHLVFPRGSARTSELSYRGALTRAEQVLFLLFLLTLAAGVPALRARLSREHP